MDAESTEAAQAELDAFEQGPLGTEIPYGFSRVAGAWSHVIPFF